ncbi:MAG: hypothetical protein KGK01_13455 [Bradyrhizobium sp.]|uniref:hypothetical protein n=1 Tax=Bradyrhizobium sp. TaxID=376 RepID=UPI00238EBC2B|nr:hypothetical protein [Bradyrhizobium sp.]MDE2243392.1 hypothetical protein [Bradyrhizobium sp.]MDE2471718.1 hypothetical protein [Bradyrhizobium sp.]
MSEQNGTNFLRYIHAHDRRAGAGGGKRPWPEKKTCPEKTQAKKKDLSAEKGEKGG